MACSCGSSEPSCLRFGSIRRSTDELLAQLALEHLARRVARKIVVADPDAHRHLEGCESLRDVIPEVLLGDLASRNALDDGTDLFAEHPMWDPDDGGFADGRMLVEHTLDLDRVHVLAAANHHVLRAVDDVQEPFVVHTSDVAGMQPAVAERL